MRHGNMAAWRETLTTPTTKTTVATETATEEDAIMITVMTETITEASGEWTEIDTMSPLAGLISLWRRGKAEGPLRVVGGTVVGPLRVVGDMGVDTVAEDETGDHTSMVSVCV